MGNRYEFGHMSFSVKNRSIKTCQTLTRVGLGISWVRRIKDGRVLSKHHRIDRNTTTMFVDEGRDHGLGTPNEALFSLKSRTFGLGQTSWAGAFVVLLVKLSAPILGTVSPCFPLFNHYFYKKTKPLYSHTKHLFGIWI